MATATRDIVVRLKRPHQKQLKLIDSPCKRIVCRAGRRSGKTTALAIKAVKAFLAGKRVLYGAPVFKQVSHFWSEVTTALHDPIMAGAYHMSKVERFIEAPGTGARISARTVWDADTLRGDYTDLLILDEYQLMAENVWEYVVAPMLIDTDGSVIFLYTPPSTESRSLSRAVDKLHAAKLYRAALDDPRWECMSFTSYDNPHVSREGLEAVAKDMTALAFRMEIMAEDLFEAPASLWKRAMFTEDRYREPPDMTRIVVAIDPTGTRNGDEVGIVVAGLGVDKHGYVLADYSGRGFSPEQWASRAIDAYYEWGADRILAETNFGGDMVASTLRTVDPNIPFKGVTSSRGKAVRAEPIAAMYEQNRIFHRECFIELEDQLCMWSPDSNYSPDRLDALVFALTELMRNRSAPIMQLA